MNMALKGFRSRASKCKHKHVVPFCQRVDGLLTTGNNMAEYTTENQNKVTDLNEMPWPHATFEQNLTYGTPNDDKSDFQEVPYQTARSEYQRYMHAAHSMIYCFEDAVLWGRYPKVGNILMQTRFDGTFGFPGGLLDKGDGGTEDPVDGLNRELEEEIGLNLQKYKFSQKDHECSHVHHKKELVTHFYAKKVDLEDYKEIEKSVLSCEEWGIETFGIIRVPLYTMDDGYRGLPVFLANRFSGNAREQLLHGIRSRQILPDATLTRMLSAYQAFVAAQ